MIKLHIVHPYQFILIPKNACTTILTAFYQLHDKSVEDVHDICKRRESKAPLNTGNQLFTFAIVRNPWDRFVSAWKNKVFVPHRPDTALIRCKGVTAGMSLDDFAAAFLDHGHLWRDHHVELQRSQLPANLDNVYLIALEHLAQQWTMVGLESRFGPLPKRNESVRIEPHLEYCQHREAVEDLFADDQKLWFSTLERFEQ